MKYLLLYLIPMLCFTQSADQIVQKHFEISGGIENWNQLNSIILEGEAVLGLDEIFKLKIYHRRPYQKRVVFIIDGQEVLNEGFDGKQAWTFNESVGKNIIVPDYEPDSFENDLMNYKKKGFRAEFIKEEKFKDRVCNIVQLTKNNNKIDYCFDKETAELLWEKNEDETLFYSEYEKVNGLSFSKKVLGKTNQGGEYTIHFNKIEINPAISDKLFKFKN